MTNTFTFGHSLDTAVPGGARPQAGSLSLQLRGRGSSAAGQPASTLLATQRSASA